MIGRFTYHAHNGTYCGAILTLGHRTRLCLTPNLEPCRDRPYDYWAEAITPLGNFICGMGEWHVAPSGAPYIDVRLYDPALRQPIHAHLWPEAPGCAVLLSVSHGHPFFAFLRGLFP